MKDESGNGSEKVKTYWETFSLYGAFDHAEGSAVGPKSIGSMPTFENPTFENPTVERGRG